MTDGSNTKQFHLTRSSLGTAPAEGTLCVIIKLNHLKIRFKAKQSGFVRFSDHLHRLQFAQYFGHWLVLTAGVCKHDATQFWNYLNTNDNGLSAYEARTVFRKQLLREQSALYITGCRALTAALGTLCSSLRLYFNIVSDYGLDGRGSIPDRGRGFFL
jgi:hypothetical protein